MPQQLILLGAGGGSRELISLIGHARTHWPDRDSWQIVGILDDNPRLSGTSVAGVTVLGATDQLSDYPHAMVLSGIANCKNPRCRLDLAAKVNLPRERWASFIHPHAMVVNNATVGYGTIVYPGAAISSNAHLGDHGVVYFNAVIHHDSTVGDGSILCAGVNISGCTKVGRGCYLGVGCAVRDHLTIGDETLVGMGSVVVKDVAAGSIVAGVPAKPFHKGNHHDSDTI